MALMSCPDCEGKVSDRAYWCPHCGFPVREYIETINSNPASNFEISRNSVEGVEEIIDENSSKYLNFLSECTVGKVEAAIAIQMIYEMRNLPKTGYTLGQIAAMDFNRCGSNYIVGIETISNIVYHACLRGILEPEYIQLQLIDEECEELQKILQERLRRSYIRRDGEYPVIVGFAGDRYSITERGMVLAEHVLSNWFASELKGTPIDWDKWNDCYINYISKYNMYDDSLFADMYIDSQIFEIINREELLFFKNLEKHILAVEQIELEEYNEEKRHQELIQILKMGNYATEKKHNETIKTLQTINDTLEQQKRLMAAYQLQKVVPKKKASVIGRGVVGGMIAGPAGAVIGVASAIDKNMK